MLRGFLCAKAFLLEHDHAGGSGGGDGRKETSNGNKIGTRCEEDWKKVKIWREEKYVGECMRLSGEGRPKQREKHQRGIKVEEGSGSMFRGPGCFADSRRVTESRTREWMLERDRVMKVSIIVFFLSLWWGGGCSAGSVHPSLARVHPDGGAWCGQETPASSSLTAVRRVSHGYQPAIALDRSAQTLSAARQQRTTATCVWRSKTTYNVLASVLVGSVAETNGEFSTSSYHLRRKGQTDAQISQRQELGYRMADFDVSTVSVTSCKPVQLHKL